VALDGYVSQKVEVMTVTADMHALSEVEVALLRMIKEAKRRNAAIVGILEESHSEPRLVALPVVVEVRQLKP